MLPYLDQIFVVRVLANEIAQRHVHHESANQQRKI